MVAGELPSHTSNTFRVHLPTPHTCARGQHFCRHQRCREHRAVGVPNTRAPSLSRMLTTSKRHQCRLMKSVLLLRSNVPQASHGTCCALLDLRDEVTSLRASHRVHLAYSATDCEGSSFEKANSEEDSWNFTDGYSMLLCVLASRAESTGSPLD